MKKTLFISATIFLFFILLFLSGEIALRVWDKYKGVTPIYTHNLVENIAIPNGYFNFDVKPSISFFFDSKNPKKFSINRWGFRAPEYDPIKPKNTTRIFFFGASPVFDPFASNEDSWTYLTSNKLSKHTKKKVEAINAGRFGYTSHEILGLFYHRVLRHSPDLIVLYTTLGDTLKRPSPYYGRDDGPQIYGNPVLATMNKRSALFSWLDYRFRFPGHVPEFFRKAYIKVLPSSTYYKEPPQEHKIFIANTDRRRAYNNKLFKRNINTIINIAQDQNVKVLIVTQLVRRIERAEVPELKILTESLRAISQEKNVPILDLHKLKLDDQLEKELLQTNHHLALKGREFLSDRLTDIIIKSNLVKL